MGNWIILNEHQLGEGFYIRSVAGVSKNGNLIRRRIEEASKRAYIKAEKMEDKDKKNKLNLMKTDELTIEDLLNTSQKKRDRIAAKWLGRTKTFDNNFPRSSSPYNSWHTESGQTGIRWPPMSSCWRECGYILEAMPQFFTNSPFLWFSNNLSYEFSVPDNPLSKDSIVLAACICEIKNIKPRCKNV